MNFRWKILNYDDDDDDDDDDDNDIIIIIIVRANITNVSLFFTVFKKILILIFINEILNISNICKLCLKWTRKLPIKIKPSNLLTN